MTTAKLTFTATAELDMSSPLLEGSTDEEKLQFWIDGANEEPLLALSCVTAKWDIKGDIIDAKT